MQEGPQPLRVSGWFLGRADPHATLRNPHRPGVRRGRAARPGRRAGVQDAVADLRGPARPQGPRDPRPGLQGHRLARRALDARRPLLARRRARSPTRASSRSSTRPIPRATTGARTTPVIDGIKARGWNLLLTVSGPVPQWATNGARDTLTRPSPAEFQKFVHAVGTPLRHEGRHLEHLERAQPAAVPAAAVLGAQARRSRRGSTASCSSPPSTAWPTPASADARVLLGETSPRGTGKVVAPLTFLRGALCLDSKYHKTSTGCAKLHARRLRPSRLHDGPGPDLQAHAAQRRHDRRALAADHGARPRREGRRDHRRTCRST